MREVDAQRTAASMATELGISRERVRQHLVALLLPSNLRPMAKRVTSVAATDRSRTGRTGAVSELLVCADLMHRGWDVYRAQTADAPFDLVAWNGKRLYRVEVKTNLISPPQHKGEWDILAVAFPTDNSIIYIPELPI